MEEETKKKFRVNIAFSVDQEGKDATEATRLALILYLSFTHREFIKDLHTSTTVELKELGKERKWVPGLKPEVVPAPVTVEESDGEVEPTPNLPSAADLDAVATERHVADATGLPSAYMADSDIPF